MEGKGDEEEDKSLSDEIEEVYEEEKIHPQAGCWLKKLDRWEDTQRRSKKSWCLEDILKIQLST